MEMERYSRQTMLPEVGMEGQKRIMDSSVLIVGLGGLGAPVAMYLTAAGVGHIGLVDSDVVGLTNLQRQVLYDEASVGLPKAECAERRLRRLSSSTTIDAYDARLTAANAPGLIAGFDIVVDCTDNFSTRLLIDDVCHSLGKPWVHGAIDGFSGIVTVFGYNNGKRYSDLYPDITENADTGSAIGTFGVLPGMVGSLQAAEALKILGGFGNVLDGSLLVIDIFTNTYNTIEY